MKLIGKRIERDGSVRYDTRGRWIVRLTSSRTTQGRVTVRPEDDEDMWHLYNLIQEVCPSDLQ